MGPGIAATLARAGMQVSAFDVPMRQSVQGASGFAAAATVLSALGVA